MLRRIRPGRRERRGSRGGLTSSRTGSDSRPIRSTTRVSHQWGRGAVDPERRTARPEIRSASNPRSRRRATVGDAPVTTDRLDDEHVVLQVPTDGCAVIVGPERVPGMPSQPFGPMCSPMPGVGEVLKRSLARLWIGIRQVFVGLRRDLDRRHRRRPRVEVGAIDVDDPVERRRLVKLDPPPAGGRLLEQVVGRPYGWVDPGPEGPRARGGAPMLVRLVDPPALFTGDADDGLRRGLPVGAPPSGDIRSTSGSSA